MKKATLKNIFRIIAISVTIFVVFFSVTYAKYDPATGVVSCTGVNCNFNSLIELASNVVNFLIFYLSLPIMAIVFAYAGFLYMANGGEDKAKGKTIFLHLFIGLIVALSAWLIVHFILSALGYKGDNFQGVTNINTQTQTTTPAVAEDEDSCNLEEEENVYGYSCLTTNECNDGGDGLWYGKCMEDAQCGIIDPADYEGGCGPTDQCTANQDGTFSGDCSEITTIPTLPAQITIPTPEYCVEVSPGSYAGPCEPTTQCTAVYEGVYAGDSCSEAMTTIPSLPASITIPTPEYCVEVSPGSYAGPCQPTVQCIANPSGISAGSSCVSAPKPEPKACTPKPLPIATSNTRTPQQIWSNISGSVNKLKNQFGLKSTDTALIVEPSFQSLHLVKNNQVIKSYIISTAKKGMGNQSGSQKTPWGTHKIKSKVGNGAELGMIFKGMKPTGLTASINNSPVATKQDYLTTRVMWLEGQEPGVNKGVNIDSYSRGIMIHGTPDEGLLGTPASHGCVRMNNTEVIQLFDTVPNGTLVEIQKN